MKRTLAIVFISALIPSLGMAQAPSRTANKLQKRYVKNPSKCIDYARKLVEKKEHRELAYYYLSISHHDLYTANQKKPSLSTSMRYLSAFYKISKNPHAIQDPALIEGIKESVEALVEIEVEKKKYRSAFKYSKKYITLFADTLPQHTLLFAKLVKPPPIVVAKPEPKAEVKNKPRKYLIDEVKLMADAKKLIGTRYKYGGESRTGLDCSGFNVYVYRQSGMKLPHSSSLQSKMGKSVSRSNCSRGDLIFFGSGQGSSTRIQHTGMIYSNENGKIKIIHCPNSGVSIEGEGDPSWDMYWEKRFLFIRRITDKELLTSKSP